MAKYEDNSQKKVLKWSSSLWKKITFTHNKWYTSYNYIKNPFLTYQIDKNFHM